MDEQLFFQKIEKDGQIGFVPVDLKLIDFDRDECADKKKNPFQYLIPICVLINLILALIASFFNWGNFLIMGLFFLNFFLVLLIFLAGNNFWLWIWYFVGRKRGWGYKIFSYINGRDSLFFGKINESEKFRYLDLAGRKRQVGIKTGNLKYFSNMGVQYAIYREGYINSVDLAEQFPVSRYNREANQSIISGVQSGILSIIDDYLALLKGQNQVLLYILLGIIALGIIGMLYMQSQNPAQVAEAIKSVLPVTPIAPAINTDLNRVIRDRNTITVIR